MPQPFPSTLILCPACAGANDCVGCAEETCSGTQPDHRACELCGGNPNRDLVDGLPPELAAAYVAQQAALEQRVNQALERVRIVEHELGAYTTGIQQTDADGRRGQFSSDADLTAAGRARRAATAGTGWTLELQPVPGTDTYRVIRHHSSAPGLGYELSGIEAVEALVAAAREHAERYPTGVEFVDQVARELARRTKLIAGGVRILREQLGHVQAALERREGRIRELEAQLAGQGAALRRIEERETERLGVGRG